MNEDTEENTELKIYNYWYECPWCGIKISVSSSSNLLYKEKIDCEKCYAEFEAIGIIEPQLNVSLLRRGDVRDKK